jgi:hypothetical protein
LLVLEKRKKERKTLGALWLSKNALKKFDDYRLNVYWEKLLNIKEVLIWLAMLRNG